MLLRPPVTSLVPPTLRTAQLATAVPVPALEALLSPERLLAPLNAASEPWVRALVWSDFRVAVALFVAAPLGLLGWAVAARWPPATGAADDRSPAAEVALRLLTSYWQASSLLLLTVALNVLEAPLGVAAGLGAQAAILASLWWWEDVGAELELAAARSSPIARAANAWRSAATVAAAVGVVLQLPFQPCVGAPSLAADAFCAPWLEPPAAAAAVVGLAPSPALETVAYGGCALYAAVWAYYAAVLLPDVGRRGRAPRPKLMDAASPLGAWRALGFVRPQDHRDGKCDGGASE